MLVSFTQLPHRGIQSLQPYVPGKSIASLAKEKGLKDIIKLASNENPLGCSPLARAALQNMTPETIAMYPSAVEHPVREKLAAYVGVPIERLMLSNGSDNLFWLLLTLFALKKNKPMVTHACAFISYAVQAQTLGVDVVQVPVHEDYTLDIPAMIEAAQQASIIFFANPNNPTGIAVPFEEIVRLLQSIPRDVIVVLDEAYFEFTMARADVSTIALQEQFPNLVITRTFSKLYGLAGLRLGYAIAHPDIIEMLIRIQPPFTVNTAAMIAASAALDDHHFVTESLLLNQHGKQRMQQVLDSLDYTCLPSACNFVTIRCPGGARTVYERLLEQGVITRPLAGYNMPEYLRISIGTPAQIDRCLQALARISFL